MAGLVRMVLAVVALSAIAACDRQPLPPEAPRPVLTVLAAPVSAQGVDTYAGEVRSRVEQSLAFRVGGKLVERRVDAGSSVRAGELLARLDPGDTALAAASAEAQRRLAEADLHRQRDLFARHFVSEAAVDARETAFKAAAAQAALARNQTVYTELRADQPGVVAQALVEVGQVVAAGQPVFRVARQDLPEVAVAIPEHALVAARQAADIAVTLWAAPERRYRGRLRELAAVADPATRTYAARIALLDADAKVVLGMSANVSFLAATAAPRVAIPLSALFQKDGQPAVWLVGADATLSLRPVEVARYTESVAELAGGLAAGERVVAAGIHKRHVGEKIRIAAGNGATPPR